MTDNEIMVLAKLKAKEGMADKVRQEGLSLVAPTRSEAGCISYDFHQDNEDKSSFMFYENWTSRKALDDHIGFLDQPVKDFPPLVRLQIEGNTSLTPVPDQEAR